MGTSVREPHVNISTVPNAMCSVNRKDVNLLACRTPKSILQTHSNISSNIEINHILRVHRVVQ